MRGRKIDLTGMTFGRLTVRAEAERGRSGQSRWLCQCSCGNTKSILSQSLREGLTKSCGCYQIDHPGNGGKALKHGKSKSTEYYIWCTMKRRCLSPDSDNYHNYGARGITIDPRWIADFREFLKDVGPRPSKQHSLDRHPNNDGNYGPGNVRWATALEQQNNKRNTRMVDLSGGARPLQEVARELGMHPELIRGRLNSGMAPDLAVSIPSGQRKSA